MKITVGPLNFGEAKSGIFVQKSAAKSGDIDSLFLDDYDDDDDDDGDDVCRPVINQKHEEKTCGDGPSLKTMFDDDKNMKALVDDIQVSSGYHCLH